jgi:flagellar hook protein FlgE
LFTSFSTPLSALSAHATAVDVVGNNLANLNTPGYKASVLSFRDLMSQSVGTGVGETQIGFGTARPLTVRHFVQGAVQASTGPLDAAIQGDGFFITRDSRGAVLYTRAGSFKVDAAGNMLTLGGERVQGWTEGANGLVNTNGPIGDIFVPVGTLQSPFATSKFSVDLNLNAAAQAGQPDGVYSTPIEIVDSLGGTHLLTIDFTKSATPNEWSYSVSIAGADIGSTNANEELANGTLTFDSTGRLSVPDATSPSVAVNVAGLVSGAADITMEWELYTPFSAPRLTQFGQPSAVSANSQDGTPAASLTRVGIGEGGTLMAQYSNGQQRVVGQLALASIRNPESLIGVGNNNFQASAKTALPAVGPSDTAGRGRILGESLEYSTVDIAREFTNLIIFQRGYQANSRVVTAMDEISQETINLKR